MSSHNSKENEAQPPTVLLASFRLIILPVVAAFIIGMREKDGWKMVKLLTSSLAARQWRLRVLVLVMAHLRSSLHFSRIESPIHLAKVATELVVNSAPLLFFIHHWDRKLSSVR